MTHPSNTHTERNSRAEKVSQVESTRNLNKATTGDVDPNIQRAIDIYKRGTKLAIACGVHQQRISRLLLRQIPLTIDDALKISRATYGAVSLKDMLPELYAAIEAEIRVRDLLNPRPPSR